MKGPEIFLEGHWPLMVPFRYAPVCTQTLDFTTPSKQHGFSEKMTLKFFSEMYAQDARPGFMILEEESRKKIKTLLKIDF